MPEAPVMVVNIEDSSVCMMHSIDASEGVRLGDYRYATLEEQADAQKRMEATARMSSVSATPHPELQTPEERKATRAAANEAASQQLTALPLGTPVLVQPQTRTAATPAAGHATASAHAEASRPAARRSE